MDRFSYSGLALSRNTSSHESSSASPHLVPFGPYGAGQWTAHPIGLLIVLGFFAMGIVGIPEWRGFLLLSASLGIVFGFVLWLWHRAKAAF